eukprot:TRINITY_DN14119_c0_g1_i1.p1 TRINITY_DN14119_c0_g1~~TRINITY_DN14119_c0_g1_i1.p1  ORF type:complete len:211 (-),score=19.90 TRINITY_DN14119_c0_g1_i1:81-713(-)
MGIGWKTTIPIWRVNGTEKFLEMEPGVQFFANERFYQPVPKELVTKLVIIRNPLNRIISQFRFSTDVNHCVPENTSLLDYFLNYTIHNLATRTLCGKICFERIDGNYVRITDELFHVAVQNLRSFEYIGTLGNIKDITKKILTDHFGVAQPQTKKKNSARRRRTMPDSKGVSKRHFNRFCKEIQKLMSTYDKWDLQLYDIAKILATQTES